MNVHIRAYNHQDDFKKIGGFLIENHLPGNRDGNFLEPIWEYAFYHPSLEKDTLEKIGIWEDTGTIVGVAHCEWHMGEAFFEIHREYPHLKSRMLDYAEKYLFGTTREGQRYLKVFVNDFDNELEHLVIVRGYQKDTTQKRPLSQMKIPLSYQPEISIPDGFRLLSLAEDNDLGKLNHLLWQGFYPEIKSPSTDKVGRQKQQSAPSYRKDLNIIVVAPDGEYAAYAGTWIETTNNYAVLEPVCTSPEYRRMGLGNAAVLEGIRRCAELGASLVYVGSEQPFYLTLGFTKIFDCNCWVRYLN